VLDDKLIERVVTLPSGEEVLPVDSVVLRALQKEQERRQKNRATIERLIAAEASLRSHPVVIRWADDSRPLPEPFPSEGTYLHVYRVAADPAHVNERIEFKIGRASCRESVLIFLLSWAGVFLIGINVF